MPLLQKSETAQAALNDIHKKVLQKNFAKYEDLYKYLVGYESTESQANNSEKEYKEPSQAKKTYWKQISDLRDFIETKKEEYAKSELKFPRLRTNIYDHWTQVEFVPGMELQQYRELVKLYVPVDYKDLPETARKVLLFLLDQGQHFCYKFASSERQDNICIWVRRDQLEIVINFLASLKDVLLPAPHFCPEYKGIGVTRELMDSYNEIVSWTLFHYLPKTEAPTIEEYLLFLQKNSTWKTRYSSKFDREILVRSLKCIKDNRCPVEATEEYNVSDFICDHWR